MTNVSADSSGPLGQQEVEAVLCYACERPAEDGQNRPAALERGPGRRARGLRAAGRATVPEARCAVSATSTPH